MNLTIEIIKSYNFKEIRTYKPDWDDLATEIETPNGFYLEYMPLVSLEVPETSLLEGLDGFICMETKEELDSFLSKTKEDITQELKAKFHEFDEDEYF